MLLVAAFLGVSCGAESVTVEAAADCQELREALNDGLSVPLDRLGETRLRIDVIDRAQQIIAAEAGIGETGSLNECVDLLLEQNLWLLERDPFGLERTPSRPPQSSKP